MTRKPSPALGALILLSLGLFGASARAVLGDVRGPGTALATPAVVAIDYRGHRRVVRDFIARHALAPRDPLPPATVTSLRAQGTVPPELMARLTPVPTGLDASLPTVPPSFRRVFAGRDLLIIDTRTDRIVAVLRDILP